MTIKLENKDSVEDYVDATVVDLEKQPLLDDDNYDYDEIDDAADDDDDNEVDDNNDDDNVVDLERQLR